MRKALGCIIPSLPKATSTYTQALLAYTFALAKDPQRTQELLDILDEKAIRAGGQIHWSQTPSKAHSTSLWSQPLSVDVELTAYVLLALLSKPNVTEADFTIASGIVAWLTRQQNAYGGFASTQDTVVALQALAKYAALTHNTKGVAEVRVRSQRGSGRKFQVSYHNRLLVQEMALREIPGKFSVQAHGSCCVFTRVGYPLPMDFSVSALCSSSKLIVSVPALYKEMRFNCALLPACCQCSKPVCYSRLRHNVSKSVASMILGVLEDGNLA